ncbi:hypothetical protein BGZ83_011214 [Gryganskiella cystojenkinii]|nr:hypothetical protein BGZ83_011214 [Gryganskiella cystojenkinii]
MTSSLPTSHSEQEPLLPDSHSNRSYTSDNEGTETSTPELSADEAEAAWLAELALRPWYRRPSIFWLTPFLFLLAISSGVASSPTAQLSIRIVCRVVLNDPSIDPGTPSDPFGEDVCKRPEVLAAAAVILGRVSAIRSILALMTMAWWTSLSDKYGRVFLLKFSIVTVVFATLLHMYAASPSHFIGVYILYADGIFRGITATGSLFNAAIFAYVGYVLVAFSLGGAIGPYLGGYITRATGRLMTTLWIATSIFSLLYFYLMITPESLQPKARNSPDDLVPDLVHGVVPKAGSTLFKTFESVKRATMSMVDPFKVFLPSRVVVSARCPSKYTPALLLLAQVFVNTTTFGHLLSFYPLTNLMFHWDTYEDGVFLSGVAMFSTFTFLVIFPLLQRAYKRQVDGDGVEQKPSTTPTAATPAAFALDADETSPTTGVATETSESAATKAVRMDLIFYFFGLIMIAISCVIFPIFRTVPALVVSEVVSVVGSIGSASGISLMTAIMPSHHTGMVMGAIGVVDTICSATAGLAYSALFAKTSKTMPWAYYYLSLSLAVTAGCFTIIVLVSFHRNSRKFSLKQ